MQGTTNQLLSANLPSSRGPPSANTLKYCFSKFLLSIPLPLTPIPDPPSLPLHFPPPRCCWKHYSSSRHSVPSFLFIVKLRW